MYINHKAHSTYPPVALKQLYRILVILILIFFLVQLYAIFLKFSLTPLSVDVPSMGQLLSFNRSLLDFFVGRKNSIEDHNYLLSYICSTENCAVRKQIPSHTLRIVISILPLLCYGFTSQISVQDK